MKKKFYVVWSGLNPGIYPSWDACQAQIKGVKGAVYKSFDSKEEAERAYASPAYEYMKKKADTPTFTLDTLPPVVERYALAVDAACSGNPGPMEYRGVYLGDGKEIFHFGPVHGTNNIGHDREVFGVFPDSCRRLVFFRSASGARTRRSFLFQFQ